MSNVFGKNKLPSERKSRGDGWDNHRASADKAIAEARKQLSLELAGKKINRRKLETLTEQRMLPVYRQVQKDFARLEKGAAQTDKPLQAILPPQAKPFLLIAVLGMLSAAGIIAAKRLTCARKNTQSKQITKQVP